MYMYNQMSYQNTDISLCGSADHVGDKASMPRGIEDGESFHAGLKGGSAYLHCLALLGEEGVESLAMGILYGHKHTHLVPLLLVGVQSPGEVPRLSILLFRLTFILL